MKERFDEREMRELVCSECDGAYAVLNPNYDEIHHPLCASCRDAARFLESDKEE